MTFLEKIASFNIASVKKLCFFNVNTLKVDILTNSKIYSILNQLKFNKKKDMLMMMKTACYNRQTNGNEITFRHFEEGNDEELRCSIQNSVFFDENRIPLEADDISFEEFQDYYMSNFGVFICEANGQAIGYGQVISNKGLYTIVNLGILDNYRQHGYGELLVKYLIEFCYRNSIKTIYIRVEKDNIKALSLYSKVGFKEYQSLFTWYKSRDLF